VLTGSVRRSADRIHIGVALFDTVTNKRSWSRQFDGPLSSTASLARDAALAVARALDVDMSDAERALLTRLPTTSAEAYDLYLRGREFELRGAPLDINGLPTEHLRAAQALYTRARDLDPDFALARARLALTQMYSSQQYDPTPARREQARLEAEAAVRSQPDLPEAHEALAYYWGVGMRDYAKSHEELRLALQSYPNSADYHLNLGTNHRNQGRWQEAVREFERAMQLEPRNPGGAVNAALTYSRLRRYAESVAAWDRAISLAPAEPMMKLIRGQVYTRWQGTVDTLEATLRRVPPSWDPKGMTTYSRFTVSRYRRRQADALAALNASKHDICIDSYIYRPRTLLRAQVYDDLGDKKKAAAEYEAARALLSDSLAAHPKDARMLVARGLAYAGLGRPGDAVNDARRAMELVPVSSNHIQATAVMGGAAEVFISVGLYDNAIELLELLLGMAAGREVSVPQLRNDPIFDPLRTEPRFEQLIARYSAN
jgi:serine/threonine-protein kinase